MIKRLCLLTAVNTRVAERFSNLAELRDGYVETSTMHQAAGTPPCI